MKFLGIDYGTKRIGVAISDERNALAFPKDILENNAELFVRLSVIIKQENVSEVVVGESRNYKGDPNVLLNSIEIFIAELVERFALPVHKEKEFLTTVEARRYAQKGEKVDASAAALILQRYLDRINKKKND